MSTNPNQAGITIPIQTDQKGCTPGSNLNITLLHINMGNVPEQARLNLEGIPHIRVSAEMQIVLHQTGEQRAIVLTIQPPVPLAESPTATPKIPTAPLPSVANIAGSGQVYIYEPVMLDTSSSQGGKSPISSFSWRLGNGNDQPAFPEPSVYLTGLQPASQTKIQENWIVLESPSGRLEFNLVKHQ